MTAKQLEREIKKLLRACNLPSPHKRGILNNIESEMVVAERAAKKARRVTIGVNR